MSDPTLSTCITALASDLKNCSWYDLVRTRMNAVIFVNGRLGIVISEVVTGSDTPTTPAAGDLILFKDMTGGTFSGYNDSILEYLGTDLGDAGDQNAYREYTPNNSALVYSSDDESWYQYYTDRWMRIIDLVLYATVTGDGASGTVTDIMTIDEGDTTFPTLINGEFWDVRIEITGTRTGGTLVTNNATGGKWVLDGYIQQGSGATTSQPTVNNSTSAVSATAIGTPNATYETPTVYLDAVSGTGQLQITVGVTDAAATVWTFTAKIKGIARTGTALNIPA